MKEAIVIFTSLLLLLVIISVFGGSVRHTPDVSPFLAPSGYESFADMKSAADVLRSMRGTAAGMLPREGFYADAPTLPGAPPKTPASKPMLAEGFYDAPATPLARKASQAFSAAAAANGVEGFYDGAELDAAAVTAPAPSPPPAKKLPKLPDALGNLAEPTGMVEAFTGDEHAAF